ncbi:hypothetical protein BGZ51_005972 [Haplosporangium sp. Z 767]|nr:hypothetical protein BGZ51_005972 [Haplosporangium sp. Z 767]KAF9196942.1 hypothetical protein BGZ50_004529 [Haplosporangium sp. Z 11]
MKMGKKRCQVAKQRKNEEKVKHFEELKRVKSFKKRSLRIRTKFNPENYDQKMECVLNDRYYEEDENVKPVFGDDIDTAGYEQNDRISTKYHQCGLPPVEILLTDDRGLNEFVSFRKFAPYWRPDLQVNNIKKYSRAKRVQILHHKLQSQIGKQHLELEPSAKA